MWNIQGYAVEEILSQGEKSIVLRGRRLHDNCAMILKTPTSSPTDLCTRARYRYTYEITKELHHPALCRTYALLEKDDKSVLVMEDIQGVSLQQLLEEQLLDVPLVLHYAIQLTEALHVLHQHNITHKGIMPENLIVSPEQKRLQVIDFSQASQQHQESPVLWPTHTSDNMLMYMAPEQTGRYNRLLDHRADLYAMGVTLYEMLVGLRPFPNRTPLSLICDHIATRPRPPYTLHARVPTSLSAVVMKLLAKQPEARYQSAYGLKADLQRCLDSLLSNREHEFQPDEYDRPLHLHTSQKLYNRDEEVRSLFHAFQRASRGNTELFLVSGEHGVGKAALLRELLPPLTRKNGWFARGSFNRIQHHPLTGVIDLIQDLLQQIKNAPESLPYWRIQLRSTLEEVDHCLVKILPELKTFLGEVPEPQIFPKESVRQCLQHGIQLLLQAFATQETPLLLQLDGLHWACRNTIHWLEQLLLDENTHHILIVGTYQQHNNRPPLFLSEMLERLRRHDVSFETITLQSLPDQHLKQMVLDTLGGPSTQLPDEMDTLLHQSQGNPLLLKELLATAERQGVLYWNTAQDRWLWDTSLASTFPTQQTLQTHFSFALKELPQETQHFLQYASCLGHQFDVRTLAHISQSTVDAVASALQPAIKRGFLSPLAESLQLITLTAAELVQFKDSIPIVFRFSHEIIHEQIYTHLDKEDRSQKHTAIGQNLLNQDHNPHRYARWFELVDHLNVGLHNNQPPKAPASLAKQNHRVGRYAILLGAYPTASRYFQNGLQLLEGTNDPRHQALALTLETQALEADLLSQQFDQMLAKENTILQRDLHLQDEVTIRLLRAQRLFQQEQDDLLLQELEIILKRFELPVPSEDSDWNKLSHEIVEPFAAQVSSEQLESFHNQKAATQVTTLFLQQSLLTLCHVMTRHFSVQKYLAVTMLRISLEHGHTPETPNASMIYAQELCCRGRFKEAEQLAHQALALNHRQKKPTLRPLLEMQYGIWICLWQNTREQAIKHCENACQEALRYGLTEVAGQAITASVLFEFVQGSNLAVILEKIHKHLNTTQNILHSQEATNVLLCLQHIILRLMNSPHEKHRSEQQSQSQPTLIEQLQASPLHSFAVHTEQFIATVLLEESGLAQQEIACTKNHLSTTRLHPLLPELYFFHSLWLASQEDLHPEEAESQNWKLLEANSQQLDRFAEQCPANYLASALLIRAEKANALEEFYQASALFDEAIDVAQRYRCFLTAAVAQERAGIFYHQHQRRRIARGYFADANQAYAVWDAQAKVSILEKRDPMLRFQSLSTNLNPHQTPPKPNHRYAESLEPLLKAQQEIAKKLEPKQLYTQLITTAMEQTGADSAYLLLYSLKGLFVRATQASLTETSILLEPQEFQKEKIAAQVIRLAERSRVAIVLEDATQDLRFSNDPHIVQFQPRSVLCAPIFEQEKMLGFFYLEHSREVHTFTQKRVEALKLLIPQVAIAIANAQQYESLQLQFKEQKAELEASQQLLAQSQSTVSHQGIAQKEMEEQLFHSEKMATLGTLMAGLAHEIKNPATFAHNGTQNLLHRLNQLQETIMELAGDDAEAEVLDYLQQRFDPIFTNLDAIYDGTQRIKGLAEDLRNFARADESERKAVVLTNGIRSTLTLVRATYKTTVKFTTDFKYEQPIECWSAQLNQVFMNLMVNAAQAILARKKSEPQSPPGHIHISTYLKNNQWMGIQVEDNGNGIPPELKKQIFNPFFTTKPVGEGTGLGLAISKRIVENHKGKFEVDSVLGQGTTMTILLPLHQERELNP